MTSTLPFLTTRSIAVPTEFFGALRGLAASDERALGALRDAGYAAGSALFDVFAQWLDDRGEGAPESLPEDRFGQSARAFFADSGWGSLSISALGPAVMALDADDWAEADGANGLNAPGCHVSTGLLAGFFGRVADAPLAVFEVECRSAGDAQCRFLLASVDVLQYVYEAMDRGVSYEAACESASAG